MFLVVNITFGMALLVAPAHAADPPVKEEPLTYHGQIFPILSKYCIECHDADEAGGEFRADTYQLLIKGGKKAGTAVFPANADESPLLQYLTGKRTPRMPKKRKALPDADIALIRQWIQLGAPEGKKPNRIKFSAEQLDFFEIQIRPLLAQHCFECHGENKTNGQLTMNSRQALLEGGKSGPAIVPGQPDASLLIKAVRHYAELKMPKNKPKLDEQTIALLEQWVTMNAPWPATNAAKGAPKIRKKYVIYESDRKHWAFSPVSRPKLPETKDKAWPRDDLDRFILAKLEAKKLAPAPQADSRALMRRISFDLTGLPPAPQDFEKYLKAEDDPTLARYVDSLLASKQFGNHWSRHWLDQVRYRPFPKKGEHNDPYRLWVVKAFNQDMPYDQFVRMQIAGDLIPSPKSDEVHLDGMVAVRPWSLKNRHFQQIDLLGRTFMGLSLFCARCHDHKLEPISRADYYAIKGIFESSQVIDAPYISEKHKFDEYMAGLARTQANETRMKKELKDFGRVSSLYDIRARIKSERQKLDDPKQDKKKVEANLKKLMADEKKRVADIEKRKIKLDDPKALEYIRLKEENKAFEAKWKNVYQFDAFVDQTDPGKIIDSKPPALGELEKAGHDPPRDPPVPRRFPAILAGFDQTPLGQRTKQSGRLELADWLADAKNPVTARLMVNRIWYFLMGEGLTASVSNFGRSGKLPTHPQLLDYLSDEFVNSNWSMKKLIRRIVLSSTYQQASHMEITRDERDKRVPLFAIARPKRLEVESIYRTLNWLEYDPQSTQRREPPADMTNEMRLLFDGANSSLIVPRRTASVSPLQALFLMNSEHVRNSTERFAARLYKLPDNAARIKQAFVLLYGREATADEIATGESFLSQFQGPADEEKNRRKIKDVPPAELARWQAYLQVLLLSNEFLFID